MSADLGGLGRRLDRAAGAVIEACLRAPLLVVAVALVLAAAALAAAYHGLPINTSTSDMISDETPVMRAMDALKARFPGRSDNIVVLIEADTPDQARDAAEALVERLTARADLFDQVFSPGIGPFFDRNGLLYLDREELLEVLDGIADSSPLIQRLRDDTTLRGLFAVVGLASEDALGDAVAADNLDWLYGRIARVAEARLDGAPALLSWQEIMFGREAEPEDLRTTVIVRPARIDYGTLLPGADAIGELRGIVREAGLTPAAGVRVSLTGGPALELDELATVQRGIALTGVLSLVLVVAILWAGLRSARMVAATLATLVIGLVWTAGFAALAVGHLNLISVAFAVLFVSLGVDFMIHLALRVQEAAAGAVPDRISVAAGTRAVASSLGLCALTTAVGFYAFLPTAYRGVAELGVIAGTGMIVALLASLTVLPALLVLWPAKVPAPRAVAPPAVRLPRVSAPAVRGGALAGLVLALAALPWLSFDANPLNLQDPEAESVRAVRHLMAEGERDLWAGASLAADAGEAERLAAAFDALGEVDRAVWLGDLVPPDQDQRLDVIQDIAFAAEPDPFATPYPAPSAAEQRAAVAALAGALGKLGASLPLGDGGRALGRALARLEAAPDAAIAGVDAGLVGALPARLKALDDALGAEPFGVDDLPEALRSRYRGTDGSLRVDVYPAEDVIADNGALARFVAALRSVDPAVTDDPVIVFEAGRVVVASFVQALASALVLILLLLYVLFRRLVDVLVVLAPLVLAGAITGAATVVLGMSFNFANVIVLPLLLGIGVDSGIHMVHRYRMEPDRPVWRTSTARAVVFSALTTIAGFGSLALSPHPGAASMGALLLIGVVITVGCTLGVLPALLPFTRPAGRPG